MAVTATGVVWAFSVRRRAFTVTSSTVKSGRSLAAAVWVVCAWAPMGARLSGARMAARATALTVR